MQRNSKLKEKVSANILETFVKVIETGRKKFGPNWKGSGGYAQPDAFTIHCAQHCRDARNSYEVRAKLKKIIVPTIIWQEDQSTK